MVETPKKKVDESWKEQVEHDKQVIGSPSPTAPTSPASAASTPDAAPPQLAPQEEGPAGLPDARFDLFLSGLAMDALIALGDVPHPATHRQAANLDHAKYLIDMLGVLEEKTRGNLTAEEERLLKDALYQLRMRYMSKAGVSP